MGQVSKAFFPSCKMDLKLGPQCLRSFQIFWEHEEQYNRLFCFVSDSYILIARYYLLCALISVSCLTSTIICFGNLDSCQTFCCNFYGYVTQRFNKSRNSILEKNGGGVRKKSRVRNKGQCAV